PLSQRVFERPGEGWGEGTQKGVEPSGRTKRKKPVPIHRLTSFSLPPYFCVYFVEHGHNRVSLRIGVFRATQHVRRVNTEEIDQLTAGEPRGVAFPQVDFDSRSNGVRIALCDREAPHRCV